MPEKWAKHPGRGKESRDQSLEERKPSKGGGEVKPSKGGGDGKPDKGGKEVVRTAARKSRGPSTKPHLSQVSLWIQISVVDPE